MNAPAPSPIRTALARWRDAVFAIDLEWLALFRILLGLLFLADVWLWAPNVDMVLTDHGIFPLSLWHAYFSSRPSFHALAGSAGFEWALLLAGIPPAVAFTLGWHTRKAQILTWIFWSSLQHRAPLILNGGDEVMRLLLFWSVFLPLHARWSLDARAGRAAAWARVDGVRNLASAALLLQVAVIYPVSVIHKLRFPVWQDLSFLERAMRIDSVATGIGRLLLQIPDLLPVISWATVQLEAFGLLLVFSPFATRITRTIGVAAYMALHGIGIGAAMDIGLFPWVMVVAWIPFLPPRRARAGAMRLAEAAAGRPESRWQRALLATLMAGVAIHLAGTLDWIPAKRVQRVTDAITVVRLDQRWPLWATVMPNRYYLFPAHTVSGREIDLHREGADLDWDHPRKRTWSTRWWKYLLQLATPPARVARPALADALAWRWNRDHPEDPVDRVELWMQIENAERDRYRTILLWSPDDLPRLGPEAIRRQALSGGGGDGPAD